MDMQQRAWARAGAGSLSPGIGSDTRSDVARPEQPARVAGSQHAASQGAGSGTRAAASVVSPEAVPLQECPETRQAQTGHAVLGVAQTALDSARPGGLHLPLSGPTGSLFSRKQP